MKPAIWVVCAVLLGTMRAEAAEEPPFIVWNNPPPKPEALLSHHTYHSAAMDTDVGYNIYLPPGYDAAGNTDRYPVVYWCHGLNNNENTDHFPVETVDAAIRNRVVPPLIFVYLNGGAKTFYCDAKDGRHVSETTVTKELIPHIDATYRTRASRDFRAIQGMSMGGFGSMHLALKHPELFGSVVAFAGAYIQPEQFAEPKRRASFERIFAGDTNLFLSAHPATLARQNADALRGRVGIKLLIGDEDGHLTNNRALHQTLLDLRLPHEFSEVPGTKHDLRRLSQWIGTGGLEFAVKHFGDARDASLDGPWVNPPTEKEAAAGTEHHVYYSELLGRPVGYNIYLPPGYHGGAGGGLGTNTARFPVVYYLHGMTDSESTHLYNVARLDEAIRAGRVPPMLCVWTYEGRTSWFADYADGSIRAESMFIRELIPHIDGRWRTVADRGHRSVHGWSMGGSGALRMAAKHPELFSSAVLFGGGFLDTAGFRQRKLDGLLKRVYGDEQHFEKDSAWRLVRDRSDALKSVALRMVDGDQDFLIEPNRRMHALLDELAIAHEYAEIPGVGHDPRRVWDAEGRNAYEFSARHFSSSPAPRDTPRIAP